ncbi:MAG: Cyclic pyranopterin monophosphate synthase [Syntrophorhabdaceae bacterium PtaU1.Bin034]|nr:MAG: Cyclic pyranopterin monophosphate synthase [Syntrophorhabdaceae bacterium PtaU1.Bin034]
MYRLLSILFLRGLLYRFRRMSGFPSAPEALSIEITHRCIARCLMCNIWRIPPEIEDLSVEDWLVFLDQPTLGRLKELDVTGGEPFVRDDLTELFAGISRLKQTALTQLRSVAITTNGFLTERVVAGTVAAASMMRESGLDLVVVLAMDAIGEIHDRIRNVKNGWQKLNATIQDLMGLRQSHPNLILGLKTTILPLNVNQLEDIARYADEHGLFTIISPCIVTAGRYANEGLGESLRFSNEDIRRMIRFYEGPVFRWSYHRSVLLDLLKGGSVRKPCSAGFNYFFVRSTGDVYPCPLIKERLGNFKETPLDNLIRSRQAREFRRKVGTFGQCRCCTEPGLERYALPFEGLSYLKLALSLGKRDTLAFHTHMGLDKYF